MDEFGQHPALSGSNDFVSNVTGTICHALGGYNDLGSKATGIIWALMKRYCKNFDCILCLVDMAIVDQKLIHANTNE